MFSRLLSKSPLTNHLFVYIDPSPSPPHSTLSNLRAPGLVRTLAGGGDSGASSGYADAFRLGARFCEPTDLCIGVVRAKDRGERAEDEGRVKHTDKHGRSAVIFVADCGNALIRRVNPDGVFVFFTAAYY